jgi:hypothetical protein
MKAPRTKAPRKEPIPILTEWKDSVENVELCPQLKELSKLLTQQDLTWDQQVSILRKLGKWRKPSNLYASLYKQVPAI